MFDQQPEDKGMGRAGQGYEDGQDKNKFTKYLIYVYILGGFLSLIANLTKADVNLPIYAFLWASTMYIPSQKMNGIVVLGASLIVDIFWIFFIHIRIYDSNDHFKLAPWENSSRAWGLWTTIINMVLKIGVGAVIYFSEKKKPTYTGISA